MQLPRVDPGAVRMSGLRLAFRRHQLLWVGILVAIIALSRVLFVLSHTGGEYWQADFKAYWDAAERLTAGGSVFQDFQLDGPYPAVGFGYYLYPPVLAALVSPLTELWSGSAEVAGALIAVVGLVLAISGLAAAAVREGVVRSRGQLLLLAALVWITPSVQETFITGNVELYAVGAFGWAWWAHREGRPALAGFLIALTILIKLQPALLLVWILAVRNHRALVVAGATLLAVPIALLPISGIDDWLRFPTALSNLVAGASTPIPSPTSALAAVLPMTAARVLLTVGGAALVWWLTVRRGSRSGYAGAIVAGFLLSPLVWMRYLALEWIALILLWNRPQARPWLGAAYVLGWGLSAPATGAFGELLAVVLPVANLAIIWWLLVRPSETIDEARDRSPLPAGAHAP